MEGQRTTFLFWSFFTVVSSGQREYSDYGTNYESVRGLRKLYDGVWNVYRGIRKLYDGLRGYTEGIREHTFCQQSNILA
jgi:hypothetical protein